MANWEYLQNNLTPLTFNTTDISDPYTLTNSIIQAADSTSEGYLGLGIMLGIFLVLSFILFRDDDDPEAPSIPAGPWGPAIPISITSNCVSSVTICTYSVCSITIASWSF